MTGEFKSEEVNREIAEEQKRRIFAAESAMKDLLKESSNGIALLDLYKTLENKGFYEGQIRSALLGLYSVNAIDVFAKGNDHWRAKLNSQE